MSGEVALQAVLVGTNTEADVWIAPKGIPLPSAVGETWDQLDPFTAWRKVATVNVQELASSFVSPFTFAELLTVLLRGFGAEAVAGKVET